jgi:sugar phosphate permease
MDVYRETFLHLQRSSSGTPMSSVARKRRIFSITWITYAGFYLCRKNLSVVMPLLHGSAGLNNLALANIVFGYSLLYVVGQFVCGPLSDRFGAKRVVGAGLVLIIISNLMMSLHASLLWLLVFACINGVGQSTGWSGLVKIMALWFDREDRGVIMAWWGTNYVFGGFIATAFAAWSVAQPWILLHLAWRRGFIFPAVILLFITIIFLFGMQERPGSEGSASAMPANAGFGLKDRSDWSDLATLLRNPALWMVSISYFFLELCRYALMFWLPLYLVERLKYNLQTSGYISSLYDLVGIAGAVLAGYISDRLLQSRRAPVSAIMLFGLGIVMLCQPALTQFGLAGVAVAISLAGVFSYGPDTLLSGAFVQDIGEAKAAATACGLVEGIGHMGSLFSPYVVVYVSGHYGWDRLFLIFAAAAFTSGMVLLPMWKLRPQEKSEVRIGSEAVQTT